MSQCHIIVLMYTIALPQIVRIEYVGKASGLFFLKAEILVSEGMK